MLRHFAQMLLADATLYNSAKHGLVAIAGESAIRIGSDEHPDSAIHTSGPSLRWLEIKKGRHGPEWSMSTAFISLEANIAMISIAGKLIKSLWVIAKARYAGGGHCEFFAPTQEQVRELLMLQSKSGSGPISRTSLSLAYYVQGIASRGGPGIWIAKLAVRETRPQLPELGHRQPPACERSLAAQQPALGANRSVACAAGYTGSGVHRRWGRNRSGVWLRAKEAAFVPSHTFINGPGLGNVLVSKVSSARRVMIQSSAWEHMASFAMSANLVPSAASSVMRSTGPLKGLSSSGPHSSAVLGLMESKISSATPCPDGMVE